MNVLLIFPKPNISFDTTHTMPLGLAYIAAVLEKEGHKVSCIDLNVQNDGLEKEAKNADVVGLYAITPAIKAAWKICERIKEINQNAVTVLGGPHPSVLPAESLEKDQVDVVICNEGEYAMADLCNSLERGSDLRDVKGISFKDNGKIIHNQARKPIKNLDELPFPAYHLFPLESYGPTRPTWINKRKLKSGTIITSRGCPYSCNFCFKGVHGNSFRYRSPENVVEEIKFLVDKYKINFLEFQDDNFNLMPDRAIEICKGIVDERIDIKWSIPNGLSRVEKVNTDFLQWAKKSGCADVWYAVESGSQRVLSDIIHKKTTLDQIKRAVRLAKESDFVVGGFVSIGNLGETAEEIMKSIDFAVSLDLDRLQITIVTPFPGSRLHDILRKEGKLIDADWDHYGPYENHVYFEYDGMTKEKLQELYKKGYRKFYLRPSYIFKAMKDPNTYANLPLIAAEAVRFLK